jgi:bacterioferritin
MQGDVQVVEYLNRGLRHELAAINQYWLHYRLLENWGYKALARKWRKESIEEMEHADKLVERIIFLDGFPNMQVLDPLHIGQTVREVLDCDLAAEMSARALYQEAASHCHAVKDYVTRDLFEKLMHDEEEHIDFLETQLDLVAKLGLELYAQHHIGEIGTGKVESRRLACRAQLHLASDLRFNSFQRRELYQSRLLRYRRGHGVLEHLEHPLIERRRVDEIRVGAF